MARNTIFITGFKAGEKITDDYWYSYQEEGEKGIFRVYKQSKMIFESEAYIGDGFEIIINFGENQTAFVTAVTPPKREEEVVAWLLGFSKRERAASYEEYLDTLEMRRDIYESPGYAEELVAGPNYEFARFCRIFDEDGRNYHSLVCWVDPSITHKEIFHLAPRFVYPETYVRKVLNERLGISLDEIDREFSR